MRFKIVTVDRIELVGFYFVNRYKTFEIKGCKLLIENINYV